MVKFSKQYFGLRLVSLSILVVYAIYNIPFLSGISVEISSWDLLRDKQDGLYNPIIKSLYISFIQTLFLLVFSLIIATLLFRICVKSTSSKFLSVLIIPIVLGNVSVAFIFKLFLLNSQWVFIIPFTKFLSLTCIQFWQYGSLFIYLLWLNQQTIPQTIWDYADAVKLNDYEKIKDILIPKQRNLLLLLFVIAFIFCYYESSKIEFIFKASRGTNTELVNQWLNRTYQSDTLINPNFAFLRLSQSAFFVLFAALLILILGLITQYSALLVWARQRVSFNISLLPSIKLSKFVVVLLFFWVLIPIGYGFYTQWANLQITILPLLPTLALTTVAAVISTFTAVFFSIISRLAWQKLLSDFNVASLLFLVLLFSLILVPPVTLLVLGFKWMQIIGYQSSINIPIAWILGHTLMSFPILASFTIATHFRLKNSYINYLDAHRVSFSEKLRDLFLIPFQGDYLLTFLLAFAMIFNEGTINNVLSDIIPSFVAELNKTISGRSADYANGMNYFLVSLILAVGSTLLWSSILNQQQNKHL